MSRWQRWRLNLRRHHLMQAAERATRRLDFSSDFFIGSVAGPRRREELYEELRQIEAELEQVEEALR